MRAGARCVALAMGMVLCSGAGAQQDRRWWVGFEVGAGQLQLSSDQRSGPGETSFAIGFAGGRRITDQVRVGAHLNGWLLQLFDLNNPTVGEGVSNLGGVVDVFPVPRQGLFLRGGYGLAMYDNRRVDGVNGHGPGWEAGGGYEFRLPENVSFVPMVEYAAGGLGKAYDPVSPQTGRRFGVLEFKLATVFRFGKSSRPSVAAPAGLSWRGHRSR